MGQRILDAPGSSEAGRMVARWKRVLGGNRARRAVCGHLRCMRIFERIPRRWDIQGAMIWQSCGLKSKHSRSILGATKGATLENKPMRSYRIAMCGPPPLHHQIRQGASDDSEAPCFHPGSSQLRPDRLMIRSFGRGIDAMRLESARQSLGHEDKIEAFRAVDEIDLVDADRRGMRFARM